MNHAHLADRGVDKESLDCSDRGIAADQACCLLMTVLAATTCPADSTLFLPDLSPSTENFEFSSAFTAIIVGLVGWS